MTATANHYGLAGRGILGVEGVETWLISYVQLFHGKHKMGVRKSKLKQ